jgi:uncharacterized membrane protein YfcA
MDQEFLALSLAIFSASALQSATGIGFGIIAGPVLLIVLNDSSAIQISIVLNLLIALFLAPSVRQKVNRPLLHKLLTGVAIGSPVGLLIYVSIDINLLKAFAGLIVLFTLLMVLRSKHVHPHSREQSPVRQETVAVGLIAGIMGGSLAMPGPVPAAWMAARGVDKTTIRATILMMFVFAYALALALQFSLADISAETWRLCGSLAPSTVGGILLGRYISHRISQDVFRLLLIIILAATAFTLLSTIRF